MTNDDTDRTVNPVRSSGDGAPVQPRVHLSDAAQAREPDRLTIDTLPDVASPEQVAEALGVHPKTIRSMCRRGKLRAARLGAIWRVQRRDVADLFDLRPMRLAPPTAASDGWRPKRRRKA